MQNDAALLSKHSERRPEIGIRGELSDPLEELSPGIWFANMAQSIGHQELRTELKNLLFLENTRRAEIPSAAQKKVVVVTVPVD